MTVGLLTLDCWSGITDRPESVNLSQRFSEQSDSSHRGLPWHPSFPGHCERQFSKLAGGRWRETMRTLRSQDAKRPRRCGRLNVVTGYTRGGRPYVVTLSICTNASIYLQSPSSMVDSTNTNAPTGNIFNIYTPQALRPTDGRPNRNAACMECRRRRGRVIIHLNQMVS